VYAAYKKAWVAEAQREELTRRELTAEFEGIAPPPDDVVIRHGMMIGLVSSDYKSGLTWEKIKNHYNEELLKHGWRYIREDPIIYDGHNYGGASALYCKRPYAVSVEYAGGQESQFGFTYGISFSAGLYDECK
jgi:hypothetical protein